MTLGQALHSTYDAVLWDVDGVLIDGAVAIPTGQETWCALSGKQAMALVTNNASRTPEQVVDMMQRHRIPLRRDQVMTSALAAASLVAQEHPNADVLAIGGDGVVEALEHAGLRVTPAHSVKDSDSFAVVVQGLGKQVSWEHLAAGTRAIHRGARWVVTNNDATLPTSDGPLPGNGALAGVIATATGTEPTVTGKPHTHIFSAALRLLDVQEQARGIMVGDRLETDIEGANRAGLDSLWVATGVHTLADVVAAPPAQRPTFLAPDATALLRPHSPAVTQREGDTLTARCHTVAIATDGKTARVISDDANPAWRATAWAALHWGLRDTGRSTSPAESLTAWATQDWPKAAL